MQPERFPTQNRPPDKPRLTLVTSHPNAEPMEARKARGDRLLAWAFAGSLLVNAALVALLSHADLFGQGRNAEAVRHVRVQVYKPPIKLPPPPKPKPGVLPPPPKPRAPLKAPRAARRTPPARAPRALRPHAAPPTPVPPPHAAAPTPRPRAPIPPPAMRPHTLPPALTPTQHTARAAGPSATPPAPPRLLPTPAPFTPAPPHFSPPAPAPPVILPPSPPAPVKRDDPPPARHDPAPPPPVKRDPAPVRREEPKRPANWVPVESQGAEVKGPCVVSFEIGENGRVSNVRIRKSSGSADFDRACQDAIRRARCAPAIQDHIPQTQRMSYPFSL